MPTVSVCATNSIHQVPLLVKDAIGREQRSALVVNVSGLRSRTIQFDDFEVLATQQVGIVRVTNVVSPDEESRYSPRNLVNAVAKLFGAKVAAVPKDAALAVIAGFDQPQPFTGFQNLPMQFGKPFEIGTCNQ